jgi:hypothetical protein
MVIPPRHEVLEERSASLERVGGEAMISAPPCRRTDMGANSVRELRALEGSRVGIVVRGGGRIDDCELVSAGRGRARTLWVYVDGNDAFVPLDDVVDLWKAA